MIIPEGKDLNQLGKVACGTQPNMNFITKETVAGRNLKFTTETYTPHYISQDSAQNKLKL